METYKTDLTEPAKVEDLMSHWDEINANHKKIIDWKEICRTVLPNADDLMQVLIIPNSY